MTTALFTLLRPKQWIKNTFVFLAMFFGGRLLDPDCWAGALIGFAALCMASSAIYCLNDTIDAPADRRDPVKRHRPVASGRVSRGEALITAAVMACAALATGWFLSSAALAVVGAYLLLNVAYCFWLKQIPLIDIMVIALGFELRLVMGGVATGVELSMWIVIMVFLLAFFLALAKRRDELVLRDNNLKKSIRRSADRYNKPFIDTSMSVLAAVMLIAYIIYTVQPDVIARFGTDKLYITSLFVLYGILRYLQLAIVEEKSGDPSHTIYTDRLLLGAVIGWLASFLFIIYG